MLITREQCSRLSFFLFILLFLLAYNVYARLYFDWYAISIIVRSYSFLFSFLCVFTYAQLSIEEYVKQYKTIYPKAAWLIVFFESRIIPFVFIYAIAVVHALIDTIHSTYWPYSGVLAVLDGRYTNIVFYSLILFCVLRAKLKPIVAITIFIVGSIVFYGLDSFFYQEYGVGYGIIGMKIVKLMLLGGILTYESVPTKKLYALMAGVMTSAIVMASVFLGFMAMYRWVNIPYVKKDVSLRLLRYGIPYKMDECIHYIVTRRDYKDFKLLIYYSKASNITIKITDTELFQLLFSEDIQLSDAVAELLLHREITIPFDSLLDYIRLISEKYSSPPSMNLVQLTARYADGNEATVIKHFREATSTYKIWLMHIMGFHKKCVYIPVLLPYCADRDSSVSAVAYSILVQITEKDPVKELNVQPNDPKGLQVFKDFYCDMCKIQ